MLIKSYSKTITFLGIAMLGAILSACGGGGSSNAEIKVPLFQVSVDRTALRFEGEEGRAIPSIAVLGSGVGTPPSTIYTGSLDLGTSLDRVTAEVVGTQLKFTVYPKPDLSGGIYNGSVQLFACPDAKCVQHFAGSPVTIPYTIVISKGFKLSPQSLTLSALSGSTASREITVQLPSNQTSFTVNTSAQWLSTSNVNSNGFTITTSAMPPGNYNGIVSVSIPSRNLDIPINYSVYGNTSTVTKLSTDVTSVQFNALSGAGTVTRDIKVTLPSWTNELKTEVKYGLSGQNWLSLLKTNTSNLTLTASSLNLKPGQYTATLQLSSGALITPIEVPVVFVVGTPSWSIAGVTNYLIDGNSTTEQLAGEVAIDVPGLPALTWNASTNSTWLKLINNVGITGNGKLQVAIDNAALIKMDNFSSNSSEVTISASGNNIPPQKVTFTIHKKLPQITFLSPSTRLPNESGTVIIRGRGFDSVSNLDQALKVNGAPVKRITRTNDTQLLIDLDGMANGETNITLNNGLKLDSGSAKLKIIPPVSFSYQAIPTQGSKGSIHFDLERQSIYTSNKTLGSLMRFAYTGGSWNISTASMTGIDSAVMSPDGKVIITSSTNRKISLLDATSLATQASYEATYVSGDTLNSLPRLAMTNNGKVYFQGGTSAQGIPYFDLTTRKFGGLMGGYTNFNMYSGPWFNVSGDGDRLLAVQSASISSNPKMLYMNASDETVKENPAAITFWYEAAQSLHGERFAEGTYKVWDRDFNLIGNVTLPHTNYYGRTPIFSPDGNRLYVLAYPSNLYEGTPTKPRIYVIDTSTKLITTTNLPVLGYFDLTDYPTCSNTNYGCNTRPLGTITPDGKTLFFVGDTNLIVVPIPTLQPVKTMGTIQRASTGSNTIPNDMTKHESRNH